ncbi:DUF2971 domain-containing protein [Sphingomonas psychrotolerans]|uniref:DUF2971 domain-containing protein n=1 Tax=Sphingomonas psychrotolerans TaxID=1327635 RepID=A0A2K8MM13_9SPHN|nr:DUF2971 domain-containing protein [Sphingomonas psychrotolerans]ATY34912.1 hypothetical protein CVN68_22645 [Sphingomonas psychrotolerans]
MRLYKYMSLASLEAVLKHNTIGFSLSKDLNDPFDFPTAPDVREYGFLGSLTASLKGSIWASHMGVCSLTRTATNSLMWAHYADKHRGAVIEIDVGTAGFLDTGTNAIPAHFGSVIYLNNPNMSQYAGAPTSGPGVVVGELYDFRVDYFQQLQRLFLSKPLCWAYEEEVRVVKCLRGVDEDDPENASGTFTVVRREEGSSMHAFHLPEGSVSRVCFGIAANPYEVQRIVNDFGLEGCLIGRKRRGSYDVQFEPFHSAQEMIAGAEDPG